MAIALAVVASAFSACGGTAAVEVADPHHAAGQSRAPDPALVTSALGPVTVPVRGAIVGVHDPSLAEESGVYYLFSTGGTAGGPGIAVRSSKNLVDWTRRSDIFDRFPAWIERAVPKATSLWAPDVSYWDDLWHLYYAVSTFGQRTSAIGLATNRTLNPTSPNYRWVDRGPVVSSHGGSLVQPTPPGRHTWNAIDPSVALDATGLPWLVWGSFAGGIYLDRLDSDGKLDRSSKPINLARRPAVFDPIEGSTLAWHDGWWYLFASFDLCCEGTASDYNVRVGRSRAITGPYVDEAGVPMTKGGGTFVIRGYGDVYGPGGESVFHDGKNWWLVDHFYNGANHGTPQLAIRPLVWSESGWPIAKGWSLAVPTQPLTGAAAYVAAHSPPGPEP